ncbi:MAG: hypothetical protein ACXWBL_01145, partial [Usitatibacter sp.]
MRLGPRAAQALAAEYALGTLRGRARRRFESMMREDRALGVEVRRWEDALTPIAESVAPIDPPKRVWREIESRIAPSASRTASSGAWRGFGLVAGGL